ncbi:MAG: UDP-N-acetylglucosamine diphosphorylase/glucosamine-1-phosphate N-acetyltransferase, partial [Betaproteobacteria bacterium]|nr:UDP-N-acetylglucosamine diphosphorylase/glucosamine-1-phosphate N-acetyltransferase [Betaproteobacteria bacterium]
MTESDISDLNVVILAAGKGTRMYSSLPKVLHALAGKPLLGHVIDTAKTLNPARIVVVYGHGGDQVPDAFAKAGVQFVKQEPQLGTGHAVQQAMPLLPASGLTLILYGDVPLTRPETLTAVCRHPSTLTVLTAHLANSTGYGRIIRDVSGKFLRMVEEKDATAEEKAVREINTGIVAAPTAMLIDWLKALRNNNVQKEYYLTDIVPQAVAAGLTVQSVNAANEWEIAGVNSRTQLAELERRYQLEYAEKLMARGVTLRDPARIDIRGELVCGQDVEIDVNCVFEGRVTLGDGVRIGAHCVLKDADIGAGTVVAPMSHIDSARCAADCRIGPYARLRPGAVLGAHAHVGNFVEMKKVELGEGSKVNHLTYLGDATIGRNVNVGAGTITCNYDGVNKFRTVIEDDAFIGSDTQLVA